MAFKKGDRVVCVRQGGVLVQGGVYTVEQAPQPGSGWLILSGPGITPGLEAWFADRFVAAPAAAASDEATDRVLAGLVKLGPRARLLLAEVTERLVKGAAEHGDFDPTKRRNWNREAAEERLDALVYETIDALERAGSWK